MAFDVEGARKAGYSDAQINDYLAQKYNFDAGGARKAGYGEDAILGHLLKKQGAPAPEQPKAESAVETEPSGSDFLRGITNYLPQLQETWGGAKTLAGMGLTKLGAEEAGRGLIESGMASMKQGEAEQITRESDSFTKALDKGVYTLITDWLPYQIGAGAANIAETLAAMGVGAVAGGVSTAGVGALPGALAGAVSKTLVKKGIKEAAEAIVKKEGREAAEAFIEAEAKKQITGALEEAAAKGYAKAGAKAYGSNVGLGAQAVLHGAGETTSRAMQEAERRGQTPEDIEFGKLAAASAVHAVSDFIVNKIGLDALNVSEKAGKGLITEVAKRAGITGLKEIPAEELQTIAERWGANLSLTDAEALREYVDTAMASMGMSIVPGGVGGARSYFATKRAKAEEELRGAKPEDIDQLKDILAERRAETAPVVPTTEHADLLMPPTDEAGKPIVEPAAETATLKQKFDEETAAKEEKTKATLEEATAKANDLIARADAGKKISRDEIQAAGTALGITFPFEVRTNLDKVNILRNFIAGEGAPSATRPVGEGVGVGVPVAEQPTGERAPAIEGTQPSGVVPTGAPTGSANVREETQPGAVETVTKPPEATEPASKQVSVEDDLNSLNNLLGDESELFARRTNVEIERDNALEALAKRYGLTRGEGEGTQSFGKRLRNAITFEKEREGLPLSEVSTKRIEEQEVKPEQPYQPPEVQVEAYDKYIDDYNKAADPDDRIPQYKYLTDDERRVYFQENLKRPSAGTQAEHKAAAQRLAEYRAAKLDETFAGEAKAQRNYNENRAQFSQRTGLAYSFPTWGSLSRASKNLFASKYKAGDALSQDLAFRAIKAQIQKEKAEQAKEERKLEKTSEKQAKEQQEIERLINSQPTGKGELLPKNIRTALLNGDIKTVLDYIKNQGKGLSSLKREDIAKLVDKKGKARVVGTKTRVRDSTALRIFRNLAFALSNIEGMKVNVVFDENMVYGHVAKYDANTNTLFIGPNGFDEATVLHELTHAATVKIIHQFFTDPSKLDARTRIAVQQIINIAGYAKTFLGQRYKNAFENVYEFVAYAMTDTDFQHDLAQIQVKKLATATNKEAEQSKALQEEREASTRVISYDSMSDNLWKAFTGTLAYIYKLFTPNPKLTRVLLPTEKTRIERAKNKKELKKRTGEFDQFYRSFVAKNNPLLDSAEQEVQLELAREVIAGERGIGSPEISDDTRYVLWQWNKSQQRTRTTLARAEEEETVSPKEEPSPYENLFDNPEEMREARIEPIKEELVVQNGITNLRRQILREPGYKGNLLLEAAAAVEEIFAAPEGGITALAGKEEISPELYAKRGENKTIAPQKTRSGGFESTELKKDYKLKGAEKVVSNISKIKQALSTRSGIRNLVRLYQNRSYELRALENKLDMAGKINRDLNGAFNNVGEQRDLATGITQNYVTGYINEPAARLQNLVGELAKTTKKSVEEVLERLHMVAEMLHEPERRHVMYVLTVPLDTKKTLNNKTKSYADRRVEIMGDPRTGKPGLIHMVELTPAQQKQLWSELEYMAKNHNDPYGDSPRVKNQKMRDRTISARQKKNLSGVMDINEDSDIYNALGIDKNEVDLRRKQYADDKIFSPEERRIIDEIFAVNKQIIKATSELNKIGNYWSFPVSNIVGMYNYQHYMPFKGVAKHSVGREFVEFEGATRSGKDLIDIEHETHGRFSTSDNPILQMLSEAYRSAGRAGRRDFTQSVKNAVNQNKLNPQGTGIIDGEVIEHVPFADRPTTDWNKFRGSSNIFHYNKDGSIDVIKIRDEKILNAIRYSYNKTNPYLEIANKITSGLGALHTRYNYNFAPLDFVRNTLQNAWNMGASRLGPVKSLTYIKNISTAVVKNGLGKSMEVAILHKKGDPASLKMLANLAKNDPFVRDMLEYIRIGGKSVYLDSFTISANLERLNKVLKKSKILDTKEKIDAFADVWNNMFEFTSRTAAYSLYKQDALRRNIAKGMSDKRGPNGELSPAEHAAAVEASAWTKNLANFENRGEKGQMMRGMYSFFSASVTGAVRSIEAAFPAFDYRMWRVPLDEAKINQYFADSTQLSKSDRTNISKAIDGLPTVIRQDQKATISYLKEYRELQKNARFMVSALIGAGTVAYSMAMLMAPDDDWDRNTVKTDNMEQWQRYLRFHIPNSVSERLGMGKDVVLQMPWGFGLGAFAAIGAQIGGMTLGNTSVKEGLGNILSAFADSFVPLPISKIPPTESLESFSKWSVDTITPSAIRPVVEYLMNTNGIGQGINSTMRRKYADAYTGGDRIPEIYKTVSDYAFRTTDGLVDWSPNSMYFFANSYADGVSKFGELVYSWANLGADKKEFVAKTDMPLIGSFFGAKSNIDSREYGKMESKIKELDTRTTTLKDRYPERYAEFEADNPMVRPIIEAYKLKQQQLNELRAQANKVRRVQEYTPREKDELLKAIIYQENMIKKDMVDTFKAYGMEP